MYRQIYKCAKVKAQMYKYKIFGGLAECTDVQSVADVVLERTFISLMK